MPEYYLALDSLPLTPSGKILKRALVEQVSTGCVRPAPVRWHASSNSDQPRGSKT